MIKLRFMLYSLYMKFQIRLEIIKINLKIVFSVKSFPFRAYFKKASDFTEKSNDMITQLFHPCFCCLSYNKSSITVCKLLGGY